MNVQKFKVWLVIPVLIITVNYINAQKNKTYEINSPDKSIHLMINASDQLHYSVRVDDKTVIKPSHISMTLDNKMVLGSNPRVIKAVKHSADNNIIPVVKGKFKTVKDRYNEIKISFKDHYSLIFRVYNNGVAYRFVTDQKGEVKVVSEVAEFNFNKGTSVYYPKEESFFSHNERLYLNKSLDSIKRGTLASLPILAESNGIKAIIEESALKDYPGMWVRKSGSNTLKADFPKYPLEDRLTPKSDRNVPVIKEADYIALTNGKRSFPWRIIALARKDADLVTNQLVFQLGEKLEIKDTSWIKPGKVAWDWWNALNVYGVDFKSGVNTETYKYFIDFASKYGIEYIILDEGWYKLGDLMDVVPEINMEEIIAYGKEKNVGVILWVVWKTLDDQLETALNQFEKWGIKGIKVDFMQRSDQLMVNYYWKIAREASKRKMLVDFHGAYKPSGLRRTYPNVISREGVKGLENNKWSKDITPGYDLILPFTRMVAGPMDYTPGAMLNAQPKMFNICWDRPMSMGTRAHQIAIYVVYESPLQMLADNPSNYYAEQESTEFISRIPTVWDDTKVLKARVGEYIIIARKNGDKWYIGAMTNEKGREFTIDLSFLGNGNFSVDYIEDGLNADRYAGDYILKNKTVLATDSMHIKMAQGGGWAAILTPIR